jgi:hypothetical protein
MSMFVVENGERYYKVEVPIGAILKPHTIVTLTRLNSEDPNNIYKNNGIKDEFKMCYQTIIINKYFNTNAIRGVKNLVKLENIKK